MPPKIKLSVNNCAALKIKIVQLLLKVPRNPRGLYEHFIQSGLIRKFRFVQFGSRKVWQDSLPEKRHNYPASRRKSHNVHLITLRTGVSVFIGRILKQHNILMGHKSTILRNHLAQVKDTLSPGMQNCIR